MSLNLGQAAASEVFVGLLAEGWVQQLCKRCKHFQLPQPELVQAPTKPPMPLSAFGIQ